MRLFRFFRLFRAWRSFGSALRLMRHPDVPLHLKLITVAAALVIISPLNILGDIPFLGIFDDVALLALLAAGSLEGLPLRRRDHHRGRARPVVDGTGRTAV